MPRQKATKLIRSGRLVGRRRVYVSWREDRPPKLEWKNDFLQRVTTETAALDECFAAPLQTGDQLPGELIEAALKIKGDAITDVVGVMTNAYVYENIRRDVPVAGELARAIAHVLEADTQDRVRVWLAPVDEATWKNYRVSNVVLADTDGRHRAWLIRLKEVGRFKWPSESAADSSDEINRAVAIIIDKSELP